MQIEVKKAGIVIYSQILDESKTLNAVIAHMMSQTHGTAVETTVTNNGHTMSFKTAEFALEPLIRKVNGILLRETRSKPQIGQPEA